jgi:mannosyltransferase
VITFTGSLTLPQPALQVVALLGSMIFILTVLFSLRTNKILVENKILVLTFIFWMPLVLFLLSYMMRPVFVPRAFIVSSLFFYGLFGILIAVDRPAWMKSIPLLAVLIAAGLSVPNTYAFNRFPRSPFQKAMETIQAQTSQDALVVHDNKLSYFPGVVYYPKVKQVFIADIPGSANDTFAIASQKAMALYPQESIQQAVGGISAVNFLVFSRTIREYQQLGYEEHPQIAWLDENFYLQEVVHVGDLEIYRYTR